ncbi:HAD family hydrolase [Peptostreptococcus faecalis]|uniref:HAD family hydrolase n=1 Tax=Peptostreptococcus faecalis TaxID=2045015 RepID=UPI000C79F2DD|nr:HAD-IB family hydrolase [Peptostreptococcus faecalis]
MSKIAAFFDIDGTLYRDSLLIEHFRKLIKYEIIDEKEWSDHLKATYMNWDKRQGNYDDYLYEISDQYLEAISGLSKSNMDFVSDQVIKLKADRVYKFTRSRINWHKSQGHTVIFISGSPDFLVSRMAKKYEVTDNIGSSYIVKDGLLTGEVIPMWDSNSKDKAIDSFVEKYDIDMLKSYAYGDTAGDLAMLRRVGHPVAINPSREFLRRIKEDSYLRSTAKIIIERKDVIYQVNPDVEHIEAGCK